MKAGAAVGKKVKELYLVKVSDIDKIFEPREFPDYTGNRIIMKAGGVWHKMPLIYNSGDYEEYSDDSDQDRNYDVSLIFREQMLSIGRTYFWQRFEREKVVAVFRAGNDLTYVVGSPEYPLSIYLYNAITDKIDREVSVRGVVKQGAWHAWIDEDAIIEEDEEPGSIFFIAGPPGSNKWEDITGRPDMDLYGSKSWVQAQGYLKYEALSGYATQDWVNSRGFLQTETDPTVPGHVKAISSTQIANWSSAYSWGNHAAQGYITSLAGYATQDWVNGRGFLEMETDPTVPGHVKAISGVHISNWDTAYSWGNHSGLYKSASWVPAWEDVSGKPATFTPTDHEHVKADITDFAHTLDSHSNVSTATKNAGQVLLWNGGAWINYSPSWLTGYTETDPVFSTHAAFGVTATKIANWDAAYGWGNHAGLYRPVAWVPAWGDVTGKPSTFAPSAHTLDSHSNVTITSNAAGEILKWSGTAWINNTLAEAGIAAASHTHLWAHITDKPTTFAPSAHTLDSHSNVAIATPATGQLMRYNGSAWANWAPNFLTGFTETDPVFSTHAAFGVTATKIANWDAAYGWGNHASAGYATQTWSNSNLVRNQIASAQTANLWINGKGLFGATSDNGYKLQVNSGSDGGSGVYVRGNIQATSNIRSEGVAYTSDRNEKTEIEEIAGKYNILEKRGYTFRKKKDPTKRLRMGVIAQEWEDIPGIVTKWDDDVLTVDYGAIVPLLLEEIKAQAVKIQKLEKLCSQFLAR